jgi:DNA-binding transcriptional regulator YiaG
MNPWLAVRPQTERKMEYRYTECGLDNVVIEGMDVMVDHAGDETSAIPNINGLHRVIAQAIITHEHGISGKELRFLRTEMGLTQDEMGRLLHVTRLTISRWERAEVPIDNQAEFMIRLLAAEKLEIIPYMTVEEVSRRCVWSAKVQPIRIDGSNPKNYHSLAAA